MNDPYKYYGVNEFLYALGLTVHPAFRGHNLGHEILKARSIKVFFFFFHRHLHIFKAY